MLNLLPERLDRILLLGAHCDDIPIGAGGMLLELCRAYPGVQVTALVLTGAGSLREEEERAALAAFTPGAHLDVSVGDGTPALPVDQRRSAEDRRPGIRRRHRQPGGTCRHRHLSSRG